MIRRPLNSIKSQFSRWQERRAVRKRALRQRQLYEAAADRLAAWHLDLAMHRHGRR